MTTGQNVTKPSWLQPHSGWHANTATLAAQLREIADAIAALGDTPISEVGLQVSIQALGHRPHRDRAAAVDLLASALGQSPRAAITLAGSVHYSPAHETSTVVNPFACVVSAEEMDEGRHAAAEGRVPDERVEEILATLNGFVVYEVEPYTEIVNGVSVLKREVVGADSNLDKAVEWALDQPEVSSTGGPDGNGAEVVLRDGTVFEFDPLDKAWSVVASDEPAQVKHERVSAYRCACGWEVDGFTAPELAPEKLDMHIGAVSA